MAKHARYSEVKHPDKFAESLSKLWHRIESYVVRGGIAAGVVVVGIAAWLVVAGLFAGRGEQAWEERFLLSEEFAAKAQEEPEGVGDKFLQRMSEFAQKHRGQPAAAITLLELAGGYLRRAGALRDEKPKEAREYLQKAADAAGQFVADFPTHPMLALAYYEAGNARLDLGEWARAAEEFDKAAASPIRSLAAMARMQAAHCYERLGHVAQARLKYEEVRVDPLAGWCAEQADFALAQLGRRPAVSPPPAPGTPAPTPPSPAPSK